MTAIAYVDISSHNGTPNLRAYWDAGYRYLMLKATEGTGYAWDLMPALARQWHSFGADARCGYYHWLYGTLSAAAQHAWFWSHVAPVWRAGTDWLMTDFEDVDPSRWVSDTTHLSVLRGFNQLCAAHGAVHTYTGNWYLANLPLTTAYLRTQPVVISDYSNSPPANPHGLRYVAQQTTDRATVPGFSAPLDLNRWLTPEPATLGGTPPNPTGGFLMSLSDAEQAAVQHQVGVTDANVKLIAALAESTVKRLANLGAAVAGQTSTLAALQTALAALHAAPAGTVDMQPVLDKIDKLPAELRALLHTQPLTLTGAAS